MRKAAIMEMTNKVFFNFLIKMSIVGGSLLKLKWKWLRNEGRESDWDEPNATKRALGRFNRIQPKVPISYLETLSTQTLGCEKHLHKCLCYDQKQHWYTLWSATTMDSSLSWEQWSPTALVGGQAWGIIIVVSDTKYCQKEVDGLIFVVTNSNVMIFLS